MDSGPDREVFRQTLVGLAVSGNVLGWWDLFQKWRNLEREVYKKDVYRDQQLKPGRRP